MRASGAAIAIVALLATGPVCAQTRGHSAPPVLARERPASVSDTLQAWSDGIVLNRDDNRIEWFDGRVATQFDSIVIFNDGTLATRLGDAMVFPNGKICRQMGANTVCD
jgi:hypothetical protein